MRLADNNAEAGDTLTQNSTARQAYTRAAQKRKGAGKADQRCVCSIPQCLVRRTSTCSHVLPGMCKYDTRTCLAWGFFLNETRVHGASWACFSLCTLKSLPLRFAPTNRWPRDILTPYSRCVMLVCTAGVSTNNVLCLILGT